MGFAGLERDVTNGLNLAVKRVENPNTGRWSSQDPLRFAAGDLNLYRYVSNDPYGGLDPFGEADEEDGPKGGHSKGERPSTADDHARGDKRRLQDQNNDKPNHKRYREYKQPKSRTPKPSGPKVHVNKYKPTSNLWLADPIDPDRMCENANTLNNALGDPIGSIDSGFWSIMGGYIATKAKNAVSGTIGAMLQ